METTNKNIKLKPSGIEWIGDVPEDWEVVKTIYCLKMPITDGPHETPDLYEDGIPFISAEAVSKGYIDFELKRGCISQDYYEECCKKYIPQKYDVYMIKSGATTGRTAIVETDEIFTIWSPLAVFRADQNKILPYFLLLVLRSEYYQKQVENSWSYGTQQNIGMRVLEKLKIALPPLAVQTRIASYLDKKCGQIDDLVQARESQIMLLRELKQTIITDAVTGKTDCRNLAANEIRKTKPSGIEWIGDVPEDWEVKKIKYIGFFIPGFAFPSNAFKEEGIKVIKITNIQPLKIDWSETSYVDKQTYNHFDYFKVRKNDLVFALTRPIISGGIKVALYAEDDCPLLNQRNSIFRVNPLNNIRYIYYLMLNGNFIQEFENKIDDTGQQPNISTEDIKTISIPVPPLTEQTAIATYLDKKCAEIDNLIADVVHQIDLLKEYKQSVITEAVTGRAGIA